MSTDTTLWLPTDGPGLSRLDGEVWLTRRDDGQLRPMFLDQMTPQHRARLLEWLRRHARLMQHHEAEWLRTLFLNRAISWDDYVPRRNLLDNTPAGMWIEDTPLVRRLHDLIRRDRDRAGRWGR